jgi:DNA-binding response OmpR family regulator
MNDIPMNTAMLIWQEGDIIKSQWTLEADEILLGRDSTCQVSLPSRWISRVHARLRREGNHYLVEDAKSKNGIFVNGQRIYKPQVLSDGDTLQLAPGLDLVFVDSESTAPLPGTVVDPLYIDKEERQIYIKGQILSPPPSHQQYEILILLAETPGKVYSRYEVIQAAWPDDHADGVSDDAVDAMIRRLRQRLAVVDAEHEYIITVRGYGFKLNMG